MIDLSGLKQDKPKVAPIEIPLKVRSLLRSLSDREDVWLRGNVEFVAAADLRRALEQSTESQFILPSGRKVKAFIRSLGFMIRADTPPDDHNLWAEIELIGVRDLAAPEDQA